MIKKPTYLIGDDVIWVSTFRNNLKYIMYTKHVSMLALARKLKMKPSSLKYRIYETRISDELAQKIADALGCTMDDLLDEAGDPWNFGKSDEEIAELNTIKKREREMKQEGY